MITDVRVADCEKGKYKDICFPITSEFYKQIKDTVLSTFVKAKQTAEETPLSVQEPEIEYKE